MAVTSWRPFATSRLKRAGRSPRAKRDALVQAADAFRTLTGRPRRTNPHRKGLPIAKIAVIGGLGFAAYKFVPKLLASVQSA